MTVWLPTDPPRPCPELLTREEAIVYLRLDTTGGQNGSRNADAAFERYRKIGSIKGVRMGRSILFRRTDLDQFIEHQQREYPT